MKKVLTILLVLGLLTAAALSQTPQPTEIKKASEQYQAKDWNGAEKTLLAFLAKNPKHARAFFMLAGVRHSNRDFQGAVEALKKNLAINETWPAMYNLAAAYARLGNKPLAYEWLEKSLNKGAAFAVNIDQDVDFADMRGDAEYKKMGQIVKQKKNPCMYSEKARQFDFWLGDWDVFVNGRKVGENLIEMDTNGCTLIENWKNTGGGTGKSINVYDASVGKWKQFYAGSQGGVYLFEGNLDGNIMKFTAETVNQKGSKTQHKFEFYNLPDGTVRQKWDTSTDGGKTYATIWNSIYKKKKAIDGRQETTGKEVSFVSAGGVALFGDLYEASAGKRAPLVMLFHQGGGDVRGEYATHIPRLVKKGYNVLAVDLRAGGDRFGSENRTVKKLGDKKYGYCEAYPDIEAALDFAGKSGFTGKTVAWGSSFSAALVFQLAAKRGDDLAGILAFSPASGGPMAECKPDLFAEDITIPVLALRPASEMKNPSTQEQFASFKKFGFETYVSVNGVHGSSMLNPDRVEGDVEAHWKVVSEFLTRTLGE